MSGRDLLPVLPDAHYMTIEFMCFCRLVFCLLFHRIHLWHIYLTIVREASNCERVFRLV